MNNLRIIFYLVDKTKENIHFGDGELFELEYFKAMNAQWQYHSDWGHQGFLSEKSNPENFESNAITLAKKAVANRDIPLEIKKVAVDDVCYDQVIKETEALRGFKRWLTATDGFMGKQNEQ